LRQAGFGDAFQQMLPVAAAVGPVGVTQAPAQKQFPSAAEGEPTHRDFGDRRRSGHKPADEIVGDEASEPFFAQHVGGVAFQKAQFHLGFDITKTHFNLPTHRINLDERIGWALQCSGQGGEQIEGQRTVAAAMNPHCQEPASDGRRL